MMRFEPRLRIWSSTRACAPAPTATMVITAATPMMMPSMVSAERSLLMRSARSAMRRVARKFMARRTAARCRERGRASPRASSGAFGASSHRALAVAEARACATAKRGDVVLVRDDHDGDAARG